jgi:hypothetical protein
MLGLMVLLAIGLYFVILMVATYWGYRFFKNRSRKSAIYSGTTVFLAIFLPVFWDWIPTVIAHDYYCKQAGFTEFKPVEQWKKENPGVWETLGRYNFDEKDNALKESGKEYMDYQGERYERNPINQRISTYKSRIRHKPLLVFTTTYLVYDEGKQEVLAMTKVIGRGPGNTLELGSDYGWSGFKLWLNKGACGDTGLTVIHYALSLNNPILDPDKNRK